MKDTLITIGEIAVLGLTSVIAGKIIFGIIDEKRTEKEEREKQEADRYAILSKNLHDIEFELVKLNSKVSSLKS